MEQSQNGSGAVLNDTSRLKRPAEEVASSETKKMAAMLPNGLHREANDAGTPTTTARVYSRKRGRETPDSAVKKAKQAKRVVAPEEKVDGILGRTADILLVLAGLRQINSGKPTSKVEAQLAADAQRNLECLVARTTPSSIVSKNSLENMLETLNFRLTADNRIEADPRLKVEKAKADDQEANSEGESSDNASEANNSGLADNTGSLLSPSFLSWEDDAETDLRQTDDYEEYPDAYMRHKQLVKVVQQLKAEPAAPRTLLPISNAYMNLAGHCGSCQAIVKETSNILVCDGCEKIYHQKCIAQYYLKFHPKGDWYCPKCVSDGNGKPQPPKYGPVRKTSGGAGTTPSRVPVKPVAQEAVVSNGPSPSHDQQQIEEEEAKAEEPEETTAAEDVRAEESEPAAEDDMSVQDAAQGGSPKEAERPSFVQWIGEPRVSRDRTFYSGFTMLGCTFNVKDCALFHPDPPDAPPFIARLQSMWEENQTNRKLVRVNWCYYPSDNQLPPDVPGRPETWEPDEVYESNHCDDNIIESIQGPCQVLSPQKYMEEAQRRAKLVGSGLSEDLPPIYLCKWNFDVREAAFRKIAED